MQLPEKEFRVVDLSQNLAFCSVTAGKMPCVTPDGAKFLTREVRFVTGIECLQYMGIYLDQDQLQAYPSGFLQDLAGNAFETSSCAANVLCNFVFLAANHLCRLDSTSSPSSSRLGNAGGADNDSGSESESDCLTARCGQLM